MKIIQSFAKFNEINPRLEWSDEVKVKNSDVAFKREQEKLLFYTFLFSYLSLNKYYGGVRMYCNEAAQKSLIKYIPYNEVKIVENKNSIKFWSYYKVDIMKSMRSDFIHVDSDVFIFADLFSKFIKNEKYDKIIQNIIPNIYNYAKDYVPKFKEHVIENDIIDPKKYDGRCHSCGVIGMRHKHKKTYIETCEKIKRGFHGEEHNDKWMIGMVCEELASYLHSLKLDLNSYQILPYDEVLELTENVAANKHNYTHMYLSTKFEPKYVKVIRFRILNDFPEASKYVMAYEKEVMKDNSLLKEIVG